MKFGFSVNGYGVGDLVAKMSDLAIDRKKSKTSAPNTKPPTTSPSRSAKAARAMSRLRYSARIDSACARFSKTATSRASRPRLRICTGFGSCPGAAPQRLMADGYGFAGEATGDRALVAR